MHMKADMNTFIFNIEHFLSNIRGPRYLHLRKVYFFVGHLVPNESEVAGEPVVNADERVIETGQDTERGDSPSQWPLRHSIRF